MIVDHTLYKIIKLQITESSNYYLYTHKVIKLQITESSSYHLYIIQSSSCKLQSHQIIIYTSYKIIKLQIIKSSNYHYFIQYHEYFCQWLLSIFLLCLVLKNFSIQSFIVKYKQNIYFEVERYDVSTIIDKEKLCNETYITKTFNIYIDRIDLSFHLSKMLSILLSFLTKFLEI